ncbi:hypothetical protein CCP3SC5AM1_1140003 [Gammaproteobacteria bacterium]
MYDCYATVKSWVACSHLMRAQTLAVEFMTIILGPVPYNRVMSPITQE